MDFINDIFQFRLFDYLLVSIGIPTNIHVAIEYCKSCINRVHENIYNNTYINNVTLVKYH